MKKIFLKSKLFVITFVIMNLFLFSSAACFAALKTWGGTTGTGLNWTNGANWVGGVAPVAGDDIVFNTPGTITFSTMPAASVAYNSLTISDGIVTLAGGVNITLTIGNAVGTDFTIAGSGSLIMGTNVSITIATNGTASISGSLTINAGRTYNTNGTTVVTTVFGTITNKGVLTCTTASKLLFQSGSAYVHDEDGGTIPTSTWNVASTCNIKGAVTTSLVGGGGQNFGNLTYDCAGMTGTVTMSTGLTVSGDFEVLNTGSGVLQMGGNFTVNGNCVIMDNFRIATSNDRTLTVNGNVAIQGGTLDMSSGGVGDVGTIDVGNNFSHTGGTITETGSGSGVVLFSTAAIHTFTSGGSVSNTVNYTVNNGATLQMATDATTVTGGTFTLSSGATLGITSPDGITTAGTALGNIRTTTRSFSTSANYLYNGTANQNTGSGYPTGLTGDLIINNSGNTVTVNATRTIASGGLINIINGILAASTNLSMLSTSSIMNSGGSMTGTLQGAGVYDVAFTGNSRSTSGELSGNGLRNITVNMTAGETLTLNAAKTIANGGSLILTSGIFDAGTNLSMGTTSSISITAGSMTGTLQGAGVYNVTYTGNSKTTSSELSGGGLNNITVSLTAGQTLTLDANRAPDGNISVTTGIFDLGAFTIDRSAAGGTFTLSNGARLIIGGTNTFPAYTTKAIGATSTIEYNGANQSVFSTGYGHLIASGSGTKTVSIAAASDVNGNLSIASGVILSVGAASFTVDLTTTIDGQLTVTSTTGTKTFDHMIINTGGLFNSTVNEDYAMTGSLQVNGTGSITSGTGTWTFNGSSTLSGTGAATISTAIIATAYNNTGTYSFSSLTVTGSGNLTNNGTISVSTTLAGTDGFIQGASGVLNFGGASITIATLTATAVGNTVNYNGGVQTVRATSYSNLTLSGTLAKTVTGSTIAGTLSMQGTATATGTSPTFGAAATLEYAGSAPQTTTNVEFKLAAVSPFNLIINNSNGVTLHAARTINGKLTLTDGILIIPTGITFTIANGNTNAIGGTGFDATKHVATLVNTSTGAKGFLRVNNMANGAAYLFPTGDGTLYLPVTLTPGNATVANNTYSVCVFSGITMNGEPNGTAFTQPQKNNCVDAVWTVNYNGPGTPTSSATTMTVGWDASLEGVNFQNYSNVLIGIAHWDGPNWGQVVGSGDNTANRATRPGITTFSPFGVGRIDPTGGVLGIKITYFNASKGNGINTLNWQAACSSSQAIFEVLRSEDGVNFNTINTITATQARCAQPFSYTDNTAPSGTVYYRLKVVDVDGKESYSAIVKLGTQVKDMQLDGIAPNPVVNFAQLRIIAAKKDVVDLAVFSLEGKVVYHSSVQLQAGTSIVNVDIANLPSGMYMIRGVFSDGQTNTLKFTKK